MRRLYGLVFLILMLIFGFCGCETFSNLDNRSMNGTSADAYQSF